MPHPQLIMIHLSKVSQNKTIIENYFNIIHNKINSTEILKNFVIDKSIYTIELLTKLDTIIKSDITSNDPIYLHFLENDTLIKKKEYEKYYNKKILTEWIAQLCKPKIVNNKIEKIFEGNMKINSYIDYIVSNNNINWEENKNMLHGSIENKIVKQHITHNLYNNTNVDFSTNITTDDVLINDISSSYDMIIFDTLFNKHNIIHASCCDKIKKLKIRGTNCESLGIHLIMKSLNKNGRGCIIVPESLLFSESNQIVETRKYLVENFNIKKITQLNENFYYTKGNKNAIIYFENNNKTSKIIFTSLKIDNNVTVESNLLDIDYSTISSNYSLYYKLYQDKLTDTKYTSIEYIPMTNLFNFNTVENNSKVLVFDKYYNDSSSIKICDKIENENNFYLSEKKNDQYIPMFLLHFIEYIIKNKINLFIKGKLQQFDTDKIKTISIPSLSKSVQESIVLYYNNSNLIYTNNLKQIESYVDLKKCLFMLGNISNNMKLDDIVSISTSKDFEGSMIAIIKNSMACGSISLIENISTREYTFLNNSYYLSSKTNNILIEYIYYYMEYNINKIIEITQHTSKPNLSQKQLENLCIPIVDLDIQTKIISYCKFYDNAINKVKLENDTIKQKDIMNIISQLYTLNQFVQ